MAAGERELMERFPVLRDDYEEARAVRFIKEFSLDLVREFGLNRCLSQSLQYDDVSRVVRLYALIEDGPDKDVVEVTVERARSISMGDNRDILTYLEWAIRGPSGKRAQLLARMRAADLLENDSFTG